MGRHFDVDLTETPPEACAMNDLDSLNSEDRANAVRYLMRLRDADLHDLNLLPWPRGPLGAWVFLARGRWRYLCQWNKGVPGLWHLELGRGRLLVERIKEDQYAAILLQLPPSS
jgi:hypothetical protein